MLIPLGFFFPPLQGDSIRTNIQLDFGDGTAVSYSNLSWTEEGIKHVYKAAGIVRVTALAENSLGYDATTLYLHVTGGQQAPSSTEREPGSQGEEYLCLEILVLKAKLWLAVLWLPQPMVAEKNPRAEPAVH